MKCSTCKFYEYELDEDGNRLERCDRFGCYLNEIPWHDPFEGCDDYVSALAIIGER